MDQALELRRQDHVHEDDRQHEGPEELAEGALQLAAAAGDGRRVGGRQVHLVDRLLQRLEPVGQRVAGRDAGAQAHLPLAVQAVDAGGRGLLVEGDEVAELDRACRRRPRDEEAA